MIWLKAFVDWVSDPKNVGEIVPSLVLITCTVAIIVMVAVATRRLGTRILRAIDDTDYPVSRATPSTRRRLPETGSRRTSYLNQ